MYKFLCQHMFSVLLCYTPRSTGSYGKLLKNGQTFFQRGYTISHSYQHVGGFEFSHTVNNTWYLLSVFLIIATLWV